jgi:hypothetical protein
VGRITDKIGRTWDIEINVTTLSRVRKGLNLNLLELVLPESALLEKLSDPILLVDVLYIVCKDQCDEKNVSDEDFGRQLTRDAIDEGWDSILEGVVGFSPRGIRPAHQKVLEKARKFRTMQQQRVEATVAAPEFEAMLDREIEKSMNSLPSSPIESSTDAGSSEGSLESNRDTILSAS